MKNFHIEYPDEGLREALIDKINNLTKPKGSLGVLEDLALQIGLIQQTLSPTLSHPHNVLFAADHGIVEEGVSKSPKEITWQQLSNFLHGGAGVNFLCRQHGFKLVLVDSGVDYDLPYEKGIINCSVGRGTHSFLKGPAMSMEEMELCLERGAKITDMIHADGCNVVSFGEMGIGNTSPSSVWMHLLTGISFAMCFIAMTTGYTFSITEKNSMERLYGILPIRKSDMVIGRYIFIIIMGLIALIFSLVAHPVILTILGETISIFDYISAAVIGIFLFALYTVFQLPGYYKFGSIKGRVFMYIPVAGFLITLLLITKIPVGENKLLFTVINSPVLLMLLAVIFVIAMYVVSILVSIKILKNKEM